MKKLKHKTYQILAERFEKYAYENFGRLSTRLTIDGFSKWLDWREEEPTKEFWRFERFI